MERKYLTQPKLVLPYLTIGRLLLVDGCGWSVFINFNESGGKDNRRILLDLLIFADHSKVKKIVKRDGCLCRECCDELGVNLLKEPKVVSLELSKVSQISQVVIHMPDNLIDDEQKELVRESVFKTVQKLRHLIPLMTLLKDIPVKDAQLRATVEKNRDELLRCEKSLANMQESYYKYIEKNNHHNGFWNLFLFKNFTDNQNLVDESLETSDLYFKSEMMQGFFVPRFKPIVSAKKSLGQMIEKELLQMKVFAKFSRKIWKLLWTRDDKSVLVDHAAIQSKKKVLQRLEFIDRHEVPTTKGRVASFIFGSDEILLTEMIFSGLLGDLNSKQTDVLLSLFVNEERSSKIKVKVKDPKLEASLKTLKKTQSFLCEIYRQCGIVDVNEEEALEALNPTLFEIIERWYVGSSFADIMKITDLYEGSVIRSIKRLYELLKQMKDCAQTLGNKELEHKFEEAATKLYRGIVFAASLYINK